MCIRDSPITEHDGSRPEKVDKNLAGIGSLELTILTVPSETRTDSNEF